MGKGMNFAACICNRGSKKAETFLFAASTSFFVLHELVQLLREDLGIDGLHDFRVPSNS